MRDLNQRLKNAVDQFYRYGEVESEVIVRIVEVLTDINDDLANGRSSKLVNASVEKAQQLLTKLAGPEREMK